MRTSSKLRWFVPTSLGFAALVFACSSASTGPDAAQGTEAGTNADSGSDGANVGDGSSSDANVSDANDVDAGPSFSPTNLSNVILWAEGDRGLSLDGGTVSSWADQSGSHNDLIAQGGSVTTTTVNGIPCVQSPIDGMIVAAVTLVKPPFFIETVVATVSATSAISARGTSPGGIAEFGIDPNPNSATQVVFFGTGREDPLYFRAEDPTAATVTVPHVVAAITDGAYLTLRIDGAQVANKVLTDRIDSVDFGSAQIGLFRNATMCEVVFATSIPADSDTQKLEAYLKTKYGL